ncbi:MAG TPA: low temperature requirement protein A [Micromonosporaceae bacterium]|nr:low temperature requirement protein A [Micromonosporaceae bacterium]
MPTTKATGRATFLELFFDLVFAYALARISARAVEDFALVSGVGGGWSAVTASGKLLLLFYALWGIWQSIAWTTSRYDPHHDWLQLIVIVALVASMVMGVAIPQAFLETGLAFATAYVIAQLSRPVILLLALGPHPYRRLYVRMTIIFSATGAVWITGALLPTNPRVVLWASAITVEYFVTRFGWPVPWLGRSNIALRDIAGEHLAERYQQFFLVALGQTIAVAGFAYNTGPYRFGQTAAFALALATSILLWRIYVQRAGQLLGEAVAKARHPATIGWSVADTHLVIVVGLTATAIGYELTIKYPLSPPQIPWIAMIIGGPVLFLAGRARFEYEVFSRVSPSRWIAALVLLASVPILVRHPPLISAALVVAVLAAVAVADARRARGRPPEPAAPPY